MSVTPLTRDQIEQAVYMDEPQSKKRKLDLVKCDRCRDDKQKCLPVNRIYPIKCDRCIEKGLSCSEGKRATRRSKQEPTIKPLPSSTIPVLNADEEILFDQWLFLLNYHSNLTMAVERLRNLEREIFKPFLDPVPKVMLRVYASIDMESLEGFTNELGAILTRVGSTLRKAALRTSEHLPASMLSSLIGSTLPVVSPTATCLLCIDFSAVSMLGCPTSRKFLDTQTQLSGHSEANHFHQGPVNRTLLKDTVSRYVKMSKKVQWDAHETFLRIGMVEMSHMSHQIGWYHPQGVGYQLFLERAEVVDCLGRSPLHFWLDDISRDLQGEELEILKEPGYISILNKPDILGRTPLHITCQYGWEAATQVLLELGADPGLRTCFLSLPLHYAAARGSAAICSMLLAHMDNSDIHDMDCEDQTALTYADDNRYAEVAMLIDRYDKNQEEPSGSSSPHEEVPIANEGNSGSSEIRITAPSANVPGGIDTFVTVAQWESLSALQENNQLRKPLDASNLDSQHYATVTGLQQRGPVLANISSSEFLSRQDLHWRPVDTNVEWVNDVSVQRESYTHPVSDSTIPMLKDICRQLESHGHMHSENEAARVYKRYLEFKSMSVRTGLWNADNIHMVKICESREIAMKDEKWGSMSILLVSGGLCYLFYDA